MLIITELNFDPWINEGMEREEEEEEEEEEKEERDKNRLIVDGMKRRFKKMKLMTKGEEREEGDVTGKKLRKALEKRREGKGREGKGRERE